MIAGIVASQSSVSGGGGGGGGTLTETAFSGFKDGVYRLNGVTAVISDLWEHNSSWDGWNASSVVSGTGLRAGTTNSSPAMTSGALAVVSPSDAGFVAVIELSVPSTPGEVEFHLRNSGASIDPYVVFREIDFIYAYAADGSSYAEIYGTAGAFPAGANKVAIRIDPLTCAARTTGGQSLLATTAGAAATGLTLLGITGFVDTGQTAMVIEAITFYPAGTDLAAALAA